MKNKKLVLICVAVLLLVAAIFVWRCCSAPAEEETADVEQEKLGAEVDKVDSAALDTEKQAQEDSTEDSEPESAQLIESEGDLIITIPDDEESDGF